MPRILAVVLVFLSGCAGLPDVERSYMECLMYDGSPTYTVTQGMRKVECKR